MDGKGKIGSLIEAIAKPVLCDSLYKKYDCKFHGYFLIDRHLEPRIGKPYMFLSSEAVEETNSKLLRHF